MSSINTDHFNNEPPANANAEKPVPTPETNTPEEAKSLIVMDGPLSDIYMRSLDIVYAHKLEVAAETQSMDAYMIAAINAEKEQVSQPNVPKINKADYVYVTSKDTLEDEGYTGMFESLLKAQHTNGITQVSAVIEGDVNALSAARCAIEDFMHSSGIKCFRSREAALEHFRNG